MTITRFESKRLLYREICIDDAELIVRWRSDPLIYEGFRNAQPLTMERHLVWYNDRYVNDSTRVEYLIIYKQSNTPIGIINVSDIQKRSLQVGYLIGELSYQRQGFAAEAINAVIDQYTSAGIVNYIAEIRSDNVASIRTVEKCGFVLEKEQESVFLRYIKVCK